MFPSRRALALSLSLLATPIPALAQAAPVLAAQPAPSAPRLIVTIVVDQFSANLFNQYRSRFTGGLKTLADQGLVHANGFQTHGLTETCPGHSTVLTGMHPATTGIPANDWVDAKTGQEVYCLAAPQNTLAHGRNTDNGPVGPDQLEVPTLADWLKAQSPQSRVFAVSGKDRGAINLNGHTGDGAYWFTEGFGLTTYVEPGQTAEARLEPVAAFNARLSETLKAQPPAWTYAFEDCRALEGDWTIRDVAFHSTVPPANYVLDSSPQLDEMTLEAAEHLLETQALGRRGVTDMLGVSLSATDRIGHGYGTQGPEMCEQMHRLDAALGDFLNKLSDMPGGALVVLTADHGGSDFVERLAARGYPQAHRVDPESLRGVNAQLRQRFDLPADPLQPGGSGLLVADAEHRALPEPLRTQVAETAVELLRQTPDVAFAETRERLLAEPMPASTLNPEMLTLRERMRLSTVADRSPDIVFAWAPSVVSGGRVGGAIAGHGTPWDYDRRVPILFWWPGATGQERFLPIRTIDIAPTLAHVMGVQTPRLEGRCIDLGGFGTSPCPAPGP